ncbi:MAG: hypothetical protein WA869_10570 [Alloacidobacterium sp.]|jgi:hypothetical protein
MKAQLYVEVLTVGTLTQRNVTSRVVGIKDQEWRLGGGGQPVTAVIDDAAKNAFKI